MGVLESLILFLLGMAWIGLTTVFALEMRRRTHEEREAFNRGKKK